ncbi:MAG: hypothetical protein J6A26_02660 [Oscillospiraceae bacterium]|nr:hypothetical protein [Oscillospiraceae bacterium]
MDILLTQAKSLLNDAPFSWAVCGGYALDLFLDRTLRTHGDIDICVFEKDRAAILSYMLEQDWRVYEFRGQGKLRPLTAGGSSESGRNLMCLKGDCELVKFYPCEEEGLLYYQFFHTGMKQFDYIEFLFNTAQEDHFVFDKKKEIERELSQALLFCDGTPYLAPEIVLLYKASQADNQDYQYDFEQTYPYLSSEQKQWFIQNLDKWYPDGHCWKR